MSQLITQKDINQARQMYVVMSNDIIQRSTYSLKGMEHKVIRYLISKIKPSDRPYTEYEFDIKDFCRLCNYDTSSSGTYIRYVKDIIENIMTHTIQIPLADGSLYMTHWIQSCRIRPTDGSFMVQFDQHLSPLLFQLKSYYTQYSLEYILPLRSKYGSRLYELLKSYMNLGSKHTISIDELKQRLGIEGKYPAYADFRLYVIEPALDEINNMTDIAVWHKPIKQGRKVTKIEFTVILSNSDVREFQTNNREKALNGVKQE